MNARADIDIEKASTLWNDGHSSGQLAKLFGVSRNVIIGLANRNREMFQPKRAGSRFTDPTQRVVKNKKREISAEEREARNQRRKERRATKSETAEDKRQQREERASGLRQRGFTAAIDILRQATGKQLHELSSCECHWPVNDGGPYLYCAAVSTDDSDYCAEHLERSLPSMANRKVKVAA